jgi:hypothetical protein
LYLSTIDWQNKKKKKKKKRKMYLFITHCQKIKKLKKLLWSPPIKLYGSASEGEEFELLTFTSLDVIQTN